MNADVGTLERVRLEETRRDALCSVVVDAAYATVMTSTAGLQPLRQDPCHPVKTEID